MAPHPFCFIKAFSSTEFRREDERRTCRVFGEADGKASLAPGRFVQRLPVEVNRSGRAATIAAARFGRKLKESRSRSTASVRCVSPAFI